MRVHRVELWALEGVVRSVISDEQEEKKTVEDLSALDVGQGFRIRAYGWPLDAVCCREDVRFKNGKMLVQDGSARYFYWDNLGLHTNRYMWDPPHESTVNLMADVVLAMALLYAVFAGCEWLIRRREARQP